MKLSGWARDILNAPEYIGVRDEWLKKLEDNYLGEYRGNPIFVNGVVGQSGKYDCYLQPSEWMIDCLENLAEMAYLINNQDMFVPLCVETGHYGVHFVDKLLGASVYFKNNQWNAKYLESEIGELADVDFLASKVFKPLETATETFLDQGVNLPLFGLPTIASCLNIAVNLYGQEILMNLLIEPEKCVHDLKIINELLKRLHRYYIEKIPKAQLQPVISWNRTQPPGYGQICGCSHQLLSPKLYAEYIAPLDDELLGVYENGGMMHICGAHSQHVETFRNMKNLKSLQLNDRACHDLQLYFDRLREDQLFWVNPCADVPVKKILDITNGRRLVIADNFMP